MKKSLGNKRNELSKEHIDQIVKIYGEFKEEENCKIFDNEDFGYRKIIIERPLRLNFKAEENTIKELYNQTAFVNLATSKKKGEAGLLEIEEGKKVQNEIVQALSDIGNKEYRNRVEFTKIIKKVFKNKRILISGPILKAIFLALGEKDEKADICVDSRGNPEADTDLRDTESVPLKEDINQYFEREVKPHVPDAWVDDSKTKVGYEIPFTRHFYKYTPLRNSEEIMLEIKSLEENIMEKLKKVMG